MLSTGKQVLLESVQRLIGVIRTGKPEPGAGDSLPLVGIAFMLLTIGEKCLATGDACCSCVAVGLGIKACMWLIYRTSKSSGVRAVAQGASLLLL